MKYHERVPPSPSTLPRMMCLALFCYEFGSCCNDMDCHECIKFHTFRSVSMYNYICSFAAKHAHSHSHVTLTPKFS